MDGVDGKPLDTRGILIVGNGHFTEPLGYLVNCFERVVRLSSFQIKGFESLVGTKTDVAAVGRIENLDAKPELVWIVNKTGFGEPLPGVNETIFRHYKNVVFIDENTFLAAYSELGYNQAQSHPTLGFLAIWMAIQLQKFWYNLPVTICGFDFGHTGHRRYYWSGPNELEVDSKDKWHDYSNERRKVKEYIGLGMVRLLNPRDYMLLDDGKIGPVIVC